MRTNLAIAILIYPMVQAVAFGLGLLAVLSTGAAQTAMPWMIAATFLVSIPVAWIIAPQLRSRRWRLMHRLRPAPGVPGRTQRPVWVRSSD